MRFTVLTAAEIFAKHPQLLMLKDKIISERPLSKEYAERFYGEIIDEYLEFVQIMPASDIDHHSHHFGLALHGLEIALYATRKERGHIFMPTKEDRVASLRDRFTFGVFIASILHDIGKIIADLEIIYFDKQNQGHVWNPLLGKMPIKAQYTYRFRAGRNYRLHTVMNPAFIPLILKAHHSNWLITEYDIWNGVMFSLSGNNAEAGLIAKLVQEGDMNSVKNSKSLPLVPNNTANAAVSKHNKVIADIRRLFFNSEKLNHVGQPLFVLSEHLLCLHPAWCDDLLEDTDNAKNFQNKLLNILGETNYIIKSENRTLNKIKVNQTSKKFGNINETFWNVVIIKRDIIDPQRQLSVGDLSIEPTPASPLTDIIHLYVKSNDTTEAPIANVSSNYVEMNENCTYERDIVTNNEDEQSHQIINEYHALKENQSLVNHLAGGDTTISNNDNNADNVTTHNNVNCVNAENERLLLQQYRSSLKSTGNKSDLICEESQRKNSNFVLAGSHNEQDTIAFDASNSNNDQTYVDTCTEINFIQVNSRISVLFLKYLNETIKNRGLVSKAQAPLHKKNGCIYCVWPEFANMFIRRNKTHLEPLIRHKSKKISFEDEIKRQILKLNYHDKMPNNVDFIEIGFKGSLGTVHSIRLSKNINQHIDGFEKAYISNDLKEFS
ncbi:TraI domain-containing protein [Photobacterium kishitanii]|uniref:TraI domain-containing protein n=1 Tax=Photobacterium kishitanii TaxID=318456 RepID=UPI0005D33ED3|nr:TraI domain-containing protein [Photobacterium kishitanii]KJG64933.1 hypothetical protein UA40_14580 [Photobacterium kishitanii]